MQQQIPTAQSDAPSPADPGETRHLPPVYLASWAQRGTLCAMHKVDGEIAVDVVPPDAAALLPTLPDNSGLPGELGRRTIGECHRILLRS